MSDNEPETVTTGDGEEVAMPTEAELVELSTLVPYANNPKKHPDHQVAKIANSIRQYGMDQHIVVDANGTIIKGHGRYQAAQDLQLASVPVIWRNGLSPDEVKGARIADNKASLDSGFDYDILAEEFSDLDDVLADTADISEMTGFPDADIDDLIERGGTSIDEFLDEPDREPSAPEPGESEPGGDDLNPDGVGPDAAECPECGHVFTPDVRDDESGV